VSPARCTGTLDWPPADGAGRARSRRGSARSRAPAGAPPRVRPHLPFRGGGTERLRECNTKRTIHYEVDNVIRSGRAVVRGGRAAEPLAPPRPPAGGPRRGRARPPISSGPRRGGARTRRPLLGPETV
jgi:hypothetical protein